MKKYVLNIEFKNDKHCLDCPLRNQDDDTCRAQEDDDGDGKEYENWEEQMGNCPLQLLG